MKRRRFLMGFSAVAAGSAAVVGSGAFTSISAKRDAEIDLENDANAYLGLFELGDGGRSSKENGQLSFQFPGDSEDDDLGLGSDSVYEFDRDANANQDGLFEVANQGAKTVEVYAEQQTSPDTPTVSIYDVDDSNRPALDDNPATVTLDPGESFKGGIRIDTHGVQINNQPYEVTLRLKAEQT